MLKYLHNSIRQFVNKANADSKGKYTRKPLNIDHLSWGLFLIPKIAYLCMAITIKQARKILGKLAENVSDADLESEIKAADLLKTLFFQQIKSSKTPSVFASNNHGKS